MVYNIIHHIKERRKQMAIQVPSALLDACVLALIAKKDAYGYSLTQDVKRTLDVSESTLYPVMRRLQAEECLTTYDMPHKGRNRRYYKITKIGLKRYRAHQKEWGTFKEKIDKILGGRDE
jgi:PadR family transcriptional regulator PadR